ncbi:hypothetical protein [Phenylobacterium sp.]|uniref:hypothetical protein n=1 Tax=Phenylobacterium sp. TaxID=1871053 RepID=UPI002F3F6DF2
MLLALTAAAVLFAQATPDAAPAAGPKLTKAAPAPEGVSDTPLVVTPSVKSKTVSPLVVTPQVKPQTSAEVQKSTVVCRTEPVLGSMFPKKVCATKAELKDRRDQDQAEVRKMQALRPYVSN